MEEHWKTIFYNTSQGGTPVDDFILSLDFRIQSKIRYVIKMLQEFGIHLGLPHIKKLTGTEFWELRILGEDSIRILYVAVTGRTFLFLHGFKKKKDKTPPTEIKIAQDRLNEFRLRK